MERSTPGRIMMLFFAAFLLLMIILPLLYPNGSFTSLDGRSGVAENWERLGFADPLTRAVYFLGDMFCHQEEARTFIINGSEMAFCQRDVSILTGVVLGLLITDLMADRIYAGNIRFAAAGAAMLALTFVEWTVEYCFTADLLPARVATGIVAGAGVAMILQYAVTKEYEAARKFDGEV